MDERLTDREYFRAYRHALGFTNQQLAKQFLGAKDVTPEIDFRYIDNLRSRLCGIIETINAVVHVDVRQQDTTAFIAQHINRVYQQVRDARIIPLLNNQGRRPEEVLFSWLRGYATSNYLKPAIAQFFGVETDAIADFGDDDFQSIETFRRTPKADLQFQYNDKLILIEFQSGFSGINDIKQHKVLEAKRQQRDSEAATICMHFDVFNGQVAFVRLDEIEETDQHWITRQQMEGQTVFNIDQSCFAWRIMDPIPSLDELDLNL